MQRGGRKRLGDILLQAGVITQDQVQKALDLQKQKGIRLGKSLIQMGFITSHDIIKALSEQLNIPYISLASYQIDQNVISLIPENIARSNQMVPLFKIAKSLTVAMVDPLDVFAIDEISRKTGLEVEPAVCGEDELNQSLDYYYGSRASMDEVVQIIQDEEPGEAEIEEPALKEAAEDAPVIRLVNLIFSQAVKEKASDIHVEPEEDKILVRYRIDGVLRKFYEQPKNLQGSIISRIKIMSELDIAERRLPQDGRFQMKVDGHDVDVRVSTIPTVNGENIVMRLLDKSNLIAKIEDLGFAPIMLKQFKNLIQSPYGIILVTGPTGSGKTTTLYSALHQMNAAEENIMTIEDPIEYRLPNIRQSQVNPKIGLTFAGGLRSFLRQDPDIIMVGEIRDGETATVAVQAALTGHLVLSTLHTNDAPGAISRLIDMGVETFLVSSSLSGIIAQRLVRKICEKCKESYEPGEPLLKELRIKAGTDPIKFYRGRGCRSCKNSGYSGRMAIFELLMIDRVIQEMIISHASLSKIRDYAQKNGMRSLRMDGLWKASLGLTSIEEVVRATQLD